MGIPQHANRNVLSLNQSHLKGSTFVDPSTCEVYSVTDSQS